MRNKLFVVLSVLVMLSMVVSACGQKATPVPTPVPAAPAAPTAVPAAPTAAPTAAPAPAAAAKAGLSADKPLNVLFVPSGQAEKILAGGEALDKLLAEKGVYTKSAISTSYAAAIEALCAGQADVAMLATLSYVLAKDKCGVEVMFNSIRTGSATYTGQIIVRKDSGIKSVADLKGKKFAYTDPASTSGYLYPVALMLKNGVDPAKDLAEAVFTGSHNAAAIAVYNKSVDAAATYVDVRSQLTTQFADIMEATEVIALTDPIPNDTISVRGDLDAEVKAKYKQAMLDVMATDAGKQAAYDIYEWDGIAESTDALFDPVRQVATSLGIQLQNWKGVSQPYLVGQITDLGGIDDKSFNQTAWAGIQRAEKALLVKGKYLESQQQADYSKNMQQFLGEKLDLIITVGFLLGVETATAAKANPDQKFAIVDYAYPDCWPGAAVGKDCGSDTAIDNVLGLTFATDQAAFLAGYAAAAMTKTGKVGAFGGIKIPTVTIFMKGMEAGVKYYNAQKGTNVEMLGWDTAADDGLFTGNFESTDDGRKFAESLMDEGADVIMPVAGPVGLGSAAACKERGCMIVGVDTDWYVSAAEFSSTYLTSVLKNMDVAVYDTIRAMTRGTFKGGTYVGTLANNGVAIAPFHDYESKVPATLQGELDQIKKDLIAKTITVDGVLSGEAAAAPVELKKVTVGQITDLGGIDDKSFNQTSYKGIQDAEKELGATGKYLESQQQADYSKNMQQFLSEKLDLIVTVGFLLGVETATAAKANPEQKFAIVDYAYPDCWPGAAVGKDCGSDTALDNVLGLTFATDQAAFLAGYAAAAMTKTGKVGAFGGIKIPTVTIFMKGMEAGIKYYNAQKGTKVELLGWDTAADDGLFTGNFESTDDGRKFAESLMDEGADIIMPVAGPVGLGSAAACKERGCMIVGVDTDWYVSAAEFSSTYLTSVLKNMDVAVFNAVKAVADGSFKGGTYVGTLADKGVAIAPFHDYDAQVSAELKAELEQIQKDLIDGKLTVDGVLAQ